LVAEMLASGAVKRGAEMVVTKAFPTSGMHCKSCALMITMDVSDVPGVEEVEVDLVSAVTNVTYDEGTVSAEVIRDAITEAGYPAQLPA